MPRVIAITGHLTGRAKAPLNRRAPRRWRSEPLASGAVARARHRVIRRLAGFSGAFPMRLLSIGAVLLAGLSSMSGHAPAQSPRQQELNRLTGAPEGTRCFRSIAQAQELSRHYVASGMCPQLNPISAARFVNAMHALSVADVHFLSDPCHVQLKLMFRAGREWIAQDMPRHCAETASEMTRNVYFKEFVSP